MNTRTDGSIIINFAKLSEDTGNNLSYFVEVTGAGSEGAQNNCEVGTSTCTVTQLSPGLTYDISVKSCIEASPLICSVASEVAKIKTLPKGE